jgi:enoyl-CoA hydratase/carnithine racemase
VGEVRLNRPEVLNAMGSDWPADMRAALAELNDDPGIRAVIVTGEGRAFCSGLDLTEMASGKISLPWFREAELTYRSLETMDKPVIAGIHGYCLGGGVQIVIACDARIAADNAVFALPAAMEAFLPGMGTWRLPRLIGMGHARHLVLSGENIGAEEAFRIGLVNRVVPGDDLEGELDAWAARYAEVPAPSLKWGKWLVNQAWDVPFERFLGHLDHAMGTVLTTQEHHAALQAWWTRKTDKVRKQA